MAGPVAAFVQWSQPVSNVVALSIREALSGIFGSVSLAAWIFLLVPQLVENYRQGAADGISLAFLIVWFIGDVTNLIGAVWAGLVPTVIALAVYFCFADLVLIAQCLYYNALNARRLSLADEADASAGAIPKGPATQDASERQHLLDTRASTNLGLPGSHQRKSSGAALERCRSGGDSEAHSDPLAQLLEEKPGSKALLKNSVSITAVCAAGVFGWALAWKAGVWTPVPSEHERGLAGPVFGAQMFGYMSAACYLGARIPQIIKNQREQSCEGLSLLFFLLSLLGNASYGASILLHSTGHDYIVTNLPWLIGSLGTMVEDAIIFVQFHKYGDVSPSSAVV